MNDRQRPLNMQEQRVERAWREYSDDVDRRDRFVDVLFTGIYVLMIVLFLWQAFSLPHEFNPVLGVTLIAKFIGLLIVEFGRPFAERGNEWIKHMLALFLLSPQVWKI